MKFAAAENAPTPRWQAAILVAWTYVVVLVVMVLSQLFAFEDFMPLMSANYDVAVLVSCAIVFAEVFALPFLLRMPLSPLMRWVSLACSLVVPVAWLALAVSAQTDEAVNSGMFGTILEVQTGVLALALSLGLAILAACSAWGLWPGRRK